MSEILTADPVGWLGREYELRIGEERVGHLKKSWSGRSARLTWSDAAFDLVRQGFGGARLFLMNGDQEVVSAKKATFFRETYEIRLSTTTLVMKREGGIVKRPFVVRAGDGREIGRVEREGWVSLKAVAHLPDDWPVPVQAFILWMALSVWSREQAAAAGA